MTRQLLVGTAESSIIDTDADTPTLEEKFARLKDSGAFDYLDKTPPADKVNDYERLAQKYDVPVLAGGWFYVLGRDENLLAENLHIGAALGSRVHNTQVMMDHADGHLVTNDEVAEAYLNAYEVGEQTGCRPTFEVHVNMWSEDFRRVAQVADLVEARGVPFRMTLDHSHVIFKIDNPREQKVFDIDQAIAAGDLILDPYTPGNVCDIWIDRGFVGHTHARAAVPNNPRNTVDAHPSLDDLPSSLHPQDTTGRGIQYPFIEPAPGTYHADWDGEKLEPWKEVIRHHIAKEKAKPDGTTTISTEFIPFPDYGGGGKYSIFDNSVACAHWLRETWQGTA